MRRWFSGPYDLAGRVRGVWTVTKSQAARRIRPLMPVLLVGVIGLVLSGFVGSRVAHNWDDKNAQTELDALSQSRRLLLQVRLNEVETMALSVARLQEEPGYTVHRSEFDRLVDPRNDVFGIATEIDWMPRVRRRDRAQHELSAAREGLVGYHISTLNSDGAPIPAGEQNEYFPIFYARGGIKTSLHFGLEISSDPVQREAMDRARDSGELAATLPDKDAEAGLHSAVFLFAPVFAFDARHDTVQNRRVNLEGFIRVTFLPGPFIDHVFRAVKGPRGVDFSFFLRGAGPNAFPFHVRSSLLRSTPAEPRPRATLEAGLHWTGEVTLANATWTMIGTPIPGESNFVNYQHAWTAAGATLLLTMAAMAYFEISRRNNSRLQGLIASLRESEEKFRSLSENAQDGIIMADAEGKVSFWNSAATRIFGYEPEEILGRSVHHVLAAERFRATAIAELPGFADTGKGALVGKTVELAGVRKNGSEIPIELSISAVRVRNAWHSIAVVRDATAHKRVIAGMEYRSMLLHALSMAASELLTAKGLEEAIPKVLKTIGEAANVDRVVLVETKQAEDEDPVPIIRHMWSSANAPEILDRGSFGEMAPSELEMDPWLASLSEGKTVMGLYGAIPDGAAKALFRRFGVEAILDVPMIVDRKCWGRIGFDDCKAQRHWSSLEVDILQTLAHLIGGAITREHYIERLTNANAIVERSPTILYRLRAEPSVPMTYISNNVDALLGLDPAELIASPQLYITFVHPDDQAKVREDLALLMTEGRRPMTVEFRVRRSDGVYRWFENHYMPISDAAGRLVEIEGVMTDITERKEASDKIALLARTDFLTGLANRATFMERLRLAFAAARRGARPFVVLYLDVDHFKSINDTLGHSMGDVLLEAVAGRLRANCRESDLAARLGGDEFVILQSELTDLADATVLASKIHDVLTVPYQLGGTELRVTVSIGIATYSSEATGAEELLAQADLALYRAKKEGRDRYSFHTDELDRAVRERVTLTDDLWRALDHEELELYYQPQVELATGRIVGMEELIRWNHPERGLLSPAAFLPMVENTGVVVALGHWVIDHACAQMNLWRKDGIAPQTLAINLSLDELKTGDKFIDAFMQSLAKWDLEPKDIELDVTESMLTYGSLTQNNVLARLQKLGVKIAIDDFGTQYSSLDYLETYRVSRLKIPRSMISAASHDPNKSAMVRAIIALARELDIEVIAQGVETEMQCALLTATPSTTKVQGYYYSEAVPAGPAAELLRQRRIVPRLRGLADAAPAA